MKNIKNKLFLGLLLSFFCLFSFNFVLANDYGLGSTTNVGKLKTAFSVNAVDNSGSNNFISSRLGTIIGAVLSFIGVIFMVLIIYGGLLWMLARGNESQVDKAKNIIIQAVIGLIIVLSAYAITSFIGNQLTKSKPADYNDYDEVDEEALEPPENVG